MARLRPRRLAALAGTALALTACGASAEPAQTAEVGSRQGDVHRVTTPAGLDCVVYDTTAGGGADCDFGRFAVPSGWDGKTGSLEHVETPAGDVEVVRAEDGIICVTLDGEKSGSIVCDFPAA